MQDLPLNASEYEHAISSQVHANYMKVQPGDITLYSFMWARREDGTFYAALGPGDSVTVGGVFPRHSVRDVLLFVEKWATHEYLTSDIITDVYKHHAFQYLRSKQVKAASNWELLVLIVLLALIERNRLSRFSVHHLIRGLNTLNPEMASCAFN